MPRLVFSPSSLNDLDEIAAYIGKENPAAADDFLDRLEQSFRKLADFPELGHERRDLVDQPLRFWPIGRFLVIYRIQADCVEIVRVLSSYRNIPSLFH